MCLGEWIDNELLYADIKCCLFSQNTPAQLPYAVTDLAPTQQQNICVPSTTEAVLKTCCMQKGHHHSSAQQIRDSQANAVHFPLPFLASYWCLVPFPSVTRPGGWHWCSEQDVPGACRMLHCTALGDRPRFAPRAVVADPERGRVGGRPDSTCPEQR